MDEMTDEGIAQTLSQNRLGVLSLARGNRAYAFPLFFAYRDGVIYFHSHPGRKDDYTDATEEACLTVVRAITEDDWYSVHAFGRVEQAVRKADKDKAMAALQEVPPPPELGETETGEPARSLEDTTYWMLEPHTLTGRKSERPASEGNGDGSPGVV